MPQQNFAPGKALTALLYLPGISPHQVSSGYAVIRSSCAIYPQLSPRGNRQRLNNNVAGVAKLFGAGRIAPQGRLWKKVGIQASSVGKPWMRRGFSNGLDH
jgi:hypothetical protein